MSEERTTDLFEAVREGDTDAVVRLLRAGVPAEATDEDGQTALYLAAVEGETGIVRLLLAAGADPDRAGGVDATQLPLCAAACWGHDETVRALLAAGARPDLREEFGVTALTWAVREGHAGVIDSLLALGGADPDLPGPGGEPPLVLAARRGSPSCVRTMLDNGARGLEEALTEARRWLTLDVEQEMRQGLAVTHPGGPYETVVRRVAEDGGWTVIVELLDAEGRPVAGREQQTGHAAIATLLEDRLHMHTPFAELAERAMRHADPTDDDWTEVVSVLERRGDEDTFRAAAAWFNSGDELRQIFAADVLAQLGFGIDSKPFAARSLPLLRELAREARDPELIQSAVLALGHHGDPVALPEILRHAGHPDPEVRYRVTLALHGLVPGDHAEGIAALIALSKDTDDRVRDWATLCLAAVEADTPEIRKALAARLDDEDVDTEAEAARGLAMRQDPRAVDALVRILVEEDPDGYAHSTAVQALEYMEDERLRRRLESVTPRRR
ncbi:hypothetical protein GCM10020367_15870 [Streptomyces sannanensis]|uniref:Ankyrin repeat domain-containing protein n=1 Tax=Streptomyces sannanensis TaxID=285536 RepID=A0ABP6S7L4_9ACTN